MAAEQQLNQPVAAADVRERFERDGYVVIDPEIPASTLERVISDLDDRFHPNPDLGRLNRLRTLRERDLGRFTRMRDNLQDRDLGPLNILHGYSYRDERRIQDAWRVSRSVKAIARAPRVLALLSDLYGREPLPFQTLNFRVGTEQAAHSDALHFNSMPAGFMCGVWVALEDIDEDNGPLVYYPGSQKLTEVTMQDVGVAATSEAYVNYETYIQQLIEREGLEPSYGYLRKGQALIWSSNLIHGGARQRDPQRTRLSQVTHYFFAGCQYYTPMHSSPDNIEWRHPRWVV